MQQKVSTQHTRDRSRRTETRNQHVGFLTGQSSSGKHVGQRSNQTANEVENEIADVAQTVLDVVAEDPEEEHVAAQVSNASMHEHGREQRQINGERCFSESGNQELLAGSGMNDDAGRRDDVAAGNDLQWDRRECVCELFVCADTLQHHKDKDVERDERVVNKRRCLPAGVVVVERKNHGPILPRWQILGARYAQNVTHLLLNGDRKSTRLNSSHGYISYAV